MKPQDILFLVVFAGLLYKHNPRYFTIAGLILTALAIPFFSLQIFFTAQRFTYYAAFFFLIAILLFLFQNKK